jgi:hypothetical protein
VVGAVVKSPVGKSGVNCWSLLRDASTLKPTCSNRGAREVLKLMVVSVIVTGRNQQVTEGRQLVGVQQSVRRLVLSKLRPSMRLGTGACSMCK